jgi:hypothetical protein
MADRRYEVRERNQADGGNGGRDRDRTRTLLAKISRTSVLSTYEVPCTKSADLAIKLSCRYMTEP